MAFRVDLKQTDKGTYVLNGLKFAAIRLGNQKKGYDYCLQIQFLDSDTDLTIITTSIFDEMRQVYEAKTKKKKDSSEVRRPRRKRKRTRRSGNSKTRES